MKKKFGKITICFCLIFLLFSCDGSLNSLLDKFNSNLFIDSGLIHVDTSFDTTFEEEKVDTKTEGNTTTQTTGSGATQIVISTTKNDGTNVDQASIKIGNTEIQLNATNKDLINAVDKGFTPPMSDEGYKQFTKEMADTLASPQKAEAYVKHLREEAPKEKQEQVKGTFALTALIAQETATKLPQDNPLKGVLDSVVKMSEDVVSSASLTQSDVYKAQLMVSIVSSANELQDTTANKAEVQTKIVNQATSLLQLSKQEAGNFDIAKVVDINSLLNSFNSGAQKPQPSPYTAKALSPTPIPQSQVEQLKSFIPTARAILVELFGYNAASNSFDTVRFERTLSSFKQMEIANRLIMANIDDTTLNSQYTLTKLTDYILSFAIYQAEIIKSQLKAKGFSLENEITAFISLNPWVVNDKAAMDQITYPESFEKIAKAFFPNATSLSEIKPNMIINESENAIINQKVLMDQAKYVDKAIRKFDAIPASFSIVESLKNLLTK